MLEPHGSPMKWPGTGGEEEAGEAGLQNARVAQTRAQDDAAVHYVFQRDSQEGEIQSLASKQRWAVGDDSIAEVCLPNWLKQITSNQYVKQDNLEQLQFYTIQLNYIYNL